MSIGAYELISIPYDDSLTFAGAIHACRTLYHSYKRLGRISAHRLRRIFVNVAAEFALHRWSDYENVSYTLFEATPFTRPNYLTLALGGRRLDSRSTFATSLQLIRRVRRNLD